MFRSVLLFAVLVPLIVRAEPVNVKTDVLPIFRQSCVQCHMGDASQGKLKLDSISALLRGGASGPAIIPGKSGDSILLKRILGTTDAPRMPLGTRPLSAEQTAVIARWIDTTDFSKIAPDAPSETTPITANPSAGNSPVFVSKVRPILAARCYSCHGPTVQQNGLRVDSLASILKGSESGKIVTPGKSATSRLVRRLRGDEFPRMPYGGPPLSDPEIQTIQQWIDAGAPGPDSTAPVSITKSPVKHWA